MRIAITKDNNAQVGVVMGVIVTAVIAIVGLTVVAGLVTPMTTLDARNQSLNFSKYTGDAQIPTGGNITLTYLPVSSDGTAASTIVVANGTTTFTAGTDYTYHSGNQTIKARTNIALNTTNFATYNSMTDSYSKSATVRTIIGQAPVLFSVIGLVVLAALFISKRE